MWGLLPRYICLLIKVSKENNDTQTNIEEDPWIEMILRRHVRIPMLSLALYSCIELKIYIISLEYLIKLNRFQELLIFRNVLFVVKNIAEWCLF